MSLGTYEDQSGSFATVENKNSNPPPHTDKTQTRADPNTGGAEREF